MKAKVIGYTEGFDCVRNLELIKIGTICDVLRIQDKSQYILNVTLDNPESIVSCYYPEESLEFINE